MVYIGCSYSLLHHHSDEWERDLAQMAAAGHNAIRVGELLASWDLFEQEPGRPDLSSLDSAFALATKHSMKVLLGTGASSPPVWLRSRHPDILIEDRAGISYPPGAMWGWACINHPAYLQEADRYLGQLLDRYGNHPSLLGWQIHNEAGYPFIADEGKLQPGWYDYNAHTINAFRNWLRKQYETIDALNNAWLWVPSNQRFASFDDVDAPRRTPAEWAVPKSWLDWRMFCCDNFNSLIKRQHEQIKKHSPQTVTMTNMYGAAYDRDGRLGINIWTLPKQCDVIGFDCYPGMQMKTAEQTGRPVPQIDSPTAWFLDFARSVAKQNGKELWLPEMESGPLGGWVKGPQYATTASDIRRWGLMGLARGARMILYQGYREWPSLPLHWGALADWHGKGTERLAASAQLAKLIANHGDQLGKAQPINAQVALLHCQRSTVFSASVGAQDYANEAMQNMYETLWKLGYTVDYIAPERLAALQDYRLLIVPFVPLLSQASAQAIAEYVDRGATVITMPRTAMVDDNCHVWKSRPGGGLNEVIGATETGLWVEDDIKVQAAVGKKRFSLTGMHHRQQQDLAADTIVLGEFANGDPAITVHKYGAGQAIHFATHMDLVSDRNRNYLDFWHSLLIDLGLRPDVEVLAEHDYLLDMRLLRHDDGTLLLFVANEGDLPVSAKLRLPAYDVHAAQNLWNIGLIECDKKGVLSLKLPASEALVALLSTN